MLVRYTLESNGKVIDSGEDQLSDMNYMGHINRYSEGDTLRYEKAMIDDWFKKSSQRASPAERPSAKAVAAAKAEPLLSMRCEITRSA